MTFKFASTPRTGCTCENTGGLGRSWILIARMLEAALATATMGIAIFLVEEDGWWGYNDRLYEFASTFLAANIILSAGSGALAFRRQFLESKKFAAVNLFNDFWAVAYNIAAGVLLKLCSDMNWRGGLRLAPAILSFINAALIVAIMLTELLLIHRHTKSTKRVVTEKLADED